MENTWWTPRWNKQKIKHTYKGSTTCNVDSDINIWKICGNKITVCSNSNKCIV